MTGDGRFRRLAMTDGDVDDGDVDDGDVDDGDDEESQQVAETRR
jgi:hypothetical protein